MHPDATTDYRFPTLFARARGEMCIAGTRMPIRILWGLKHRHNLSSEAIHCEYPHLTRDQIEDAIARVEFGSH